MRNKKTQQALTLFDEIVYISETIKKAKQRIKEINLDSNEKRKDAVEMALELYINKLCHKHGYYDSEKKLIVFLLSGNTKNMIDAKFPILDELIQIYSIVSFIVREVEEEKGEK